MHRLKVAILLALGFVVGVMGGGASTATTAQSQQQSPCEVPKQLGTYRGDFVGLLVFESADGTLTGVRPLFSPAGQPQCRIETIVIRR